MRKKKVIIILSVFIAILVLGLCIFYLKTSSKKALDEIEVSSYNIEFLNDELQNEDTNLIDDDIEKSNEVESKNIAEDTATQVNTQDEIEDTPNEKSASSSTSKTSTQTTTTTSKQTTETLVNNKNETTSNKESTSTEQTSTTTQQTQETQQTDSKTTTKSDLGYWCNEGGTHHIYGDGANEHGYYNSWDEAWSACQDFMKGIENSVHYKVDQCWCGLYYFWVEEIK